MKQKLLIVIILLLTLQSQLPAQEEMELFLSISSKPDGTTWEAGVKKRIELDFSIRDSVDYNGNLYIRAWSEHPSVLTFINKDGSITVCTSDDNEKITYVYEFNQNMEEANKFSFKNELGSLGAFTKDADGNYYFFYGRSVSSQKTENMAVVKYNKQKEKINSYILTATPKGSFDGIRKPFDAGTCRLELSDNMLAVYFAREMFSGHQASYGFILDKDSFERIDRGAATNPDLNAGLSIMPYTSHSFNQYILPIENGFIFADHGDAYPRGFTFARFIKGSNTKRLHAFKFPGQTGANATYAEMGGLVKTQEGFLFLGAYGRVKENCRNLFTISFDNDLTKCTSPVYLTSYKGKDGHAGHPKIVSLEDGRYLVLWEFFSYSTQSANTIVGYRTGYLSTFAILINEKGETVSEIQEYKNMRLNINDTLRYNKKNKTAYWAINDTSNSISIYGLKVE